MAQPRRRRAYLMFEILIAGAILSVSLGSLIGFLAGARRTASATANEVVAMQIARTKAEELLASPHIVVPAGAFEPVDAARLPGFVWRWAESQTALQSSSTPTLPTVDTLHEIVVTVEFPAATNVRETRVLRRYKTKR